MFCGNPLVALILKTIGKNVYGIVSYELKENFDIDLDKYKEAFLHLGIDILSASQVNNKIMIEYANSASSNDIKKYKRNIESASSGSRSVSNTYICARSHF